MLHRFITLLGAALCGFTICCAQKLDTKTLRADMDSFVREMTLDFENFRQQSMQQFVEFVKKPWKEFEESKPIPKPDPKPVPPVVIEDESRDKPIEDKPIVIEDVTPPVIEVPQPQPVEPIEEVPVVIPEYMSFTYFGTTDRVRLDRESLPKLSGINESNIASILRELTSEEYDNLVIDCLEIRKNRQLCDWAYLHMLNRLAATAYPRRNNEAQVQMAYIFMQSGYKMRFAADDSNLYMLFASKHYIFEKNYYLIDSERYYGLDNLPQRLRICEISYPKEQALSLQINNVQLFAADCSNSRKLKSDRYSDMSFDISVNKNMIDFNSTYPTSMLGGDVLTRWVLYANTPMDTNVATPQYIKLKSLLSGKSQIDAANMLLNTIQTGMVYEYDNVIWGGDRAFFAEESLYYPFCDCEDRAILLTRIVRDIMGLNCLLVYYPGHLAAAIEFTDATPKGDYIM